jgi:iron complex outermembrane receptor protein
MSRSAMMRGVSACAVSLAIFSSSASAQSELPTIVVGKAKQQRLGEPTRPKTTASSAPIRMEPENVAPIEPSFTSPIINYAMTKPGLGMPADFKPGVGSLTAPSTANLRKELLSNVGAVQFVDQNTPEQQTRYVFDLRDQLKDTPGVYVESRYGQELRITMRGSNLTRDYHLRGLELLQDGIPMNYADGSGDVYQIDPHYYRATEVYKGGNALAFGSSMLGGAINFVSPTAYTALAPNILSIDAGSFGQIRGQAQGSRVFGNLDLLVNGTFTKQDGYRQHEKTDYTQINGNVGYKLSEQLESRVYYGIYNTWQQLPGTLGLETALHDPTASLAPFPTGYGLCEQVNGEQGPCAFSGNQQRNEKNYRISNKTTYKSDLGTLDLNSWYINSYLYHPVFVVIEQRQQNWGVQPRLTSKFDIAGHENNLIAGARVWGSGGSDNWYTNMNGLIANPYGPSGVPTLDFSGGFPPAANFTPFSQGFPPYSWNALSQFGVLNTCTQPISFGGSFPVLQANCPGFVNVGQDPRIRNNSMNAFNVEGFFEDRVTIVPSLQAMFGAKWFSDTRNYTINGGIPYEPVPGFNGRNYQALNPKVGVMFEPAPEMQFFADMTGSRDVPDFIDLTQGHFPPVQPTTLRTGYSGYGQQFTPLKMQKGWTGELGSRGHWDRLTWDVTYYYTSLSDELLKFNVSPGSGYPATTFNAPHTVHQGVELGGSLELMKDVLGKDEGDVLKVNQVWTFNNFYFDNDPTYGNNQLPGIPRHVLRTTLSYQRPDGIYLAPQADWVPEGAYVDYAHTLHAPGYFLIGMQGGMKLPGGMTFYVDGRNLANRNWVSDVLTVANAYNPPGNPPEWRVGNPRVFYPGNGMSVNTGLKWQF